MGLFKSIFSDHQSSFFIYSVEICQTKGESEKAESYNQYQSCLLWWYTKNNSYFGSLFFFLNLFFYDKLK